MGKRYLATLSIAIAFSLTTGTQASGFIDQTVRSNTQAELRAGVLYGVSAFITALAAQYPAVYLVNPSQNLDVGVHLTVKRIIVQTSVIQEVFCAMQVTNGLPVVSTPNVLLGQLAFAGKAGPVAFVSTQSLAGAPVRTSFVYAFTVQNGTNSLPLGDSDNPVGEVGFSTSAGQQITFFCMGSVAGSSLTVDFIWAETR